MPHGFDALKSWGAKGEVRYIYSRIRFRASSKVSSNDDGGPFLLSMGTLGLAQGAGLLAFSLSSLVSSSLSASRDTSSTTFSCNSMSRSFPGGVGERTTSSTERWSPLVAVGSTRGLVCLASTVVSVL